MLPSQLFCIVVSGRVGVGRASTEATLLPMYLRSLFTIDAPTLCRQTR